MSGAECTSLGLATVSLAAAPIATVTAKIVAAPREIDGVLSEYGAYGEPSAILDRQSEIDRLFASDELEDIYAALEAERDLHRLLHEGATMATFEDEMRQEYAVGSRVVQRHDFIEGVRAVIVDKDNAPRWDPPTPEGVTPHVVDQIFAPLSDAGAWTPA